MGNAVYLKNGHGPIEQRKGIVQKYTASIQHIGRTLRDKRESGKLQLGKL